MPDEDIVETVSVTVNDAAKALFSAIKHCYMISDDDFYNINVKDIFKVGLSDVTNEDVFKHLGLVLDPARIGEMGAKNFNEVLDIIRFSFAIRLPFVKKYAPDSSVKEGQIKQMYDELEQLGFANPDGIIEYSFKSMSWMVKTKKTEPSFDTEWFRSWIYTYGHELASINNRNMFILGCADALFPLYYSALQEKLITQFNNA